MRADVRMEPERVRAHIQQGAGTHFDPKVVKAFLEMRSLKRP